MAVCLTLTESSALSKESDAHLTPHHVAQCALSFSSFSSKTLLRPYSFVFPLHDCPFAHILDVNEKIAAVRRAA